MNRLTWLFALSLLFSSTVWAANWQSAQQRWAEIQYRLPPDQQSAAMQAVIDELDAELSTQPKQVEALIWRGIAEATLAGYQGGLGALSLLRDARRDLEAAIAIDERALNGAAHTSLGSLYYQVPGWPISFGSNSKAEAELKKGLAIAPQDIDANYFYADYLRDRGDKAQARVYYERALAAPARPGRSLADEGRREQIRQALSAMD